MTFKPGKSGNPSGRPRKSAREDGWASVLTGLGTTRDKRTSVGFCADVVTDAEARELWRADDLAARAIEGYPDEMLRAGYDVSVQHDDEDADQARESAEGAEEELKRVGADEAFRTALCYERAYGGAAIFPAINDLAGDLSKPLNEQAIQDVKRLVVFEPRELVPRSWYTDPLDDKYGMPATYDLQPIGVYGSHAGATVKTIHESRLIIFPGTRVSRAQQTGVQYQGWGDSVLTRVRDTIRDFNGGFGSITHLLQDFSQAVAWIRGLHDAVAADEGAVIRRKMEVMDVSRSVLRLLMLDAGGEGKAPENFERKATPMSGVAETLDRLMYRIASALEMPASMLFGMAPSGLNATGDGDIKLFEKRVGQKQDRHLRPRLERLIKLIFLSRGGPTSGRAPEKWCVEFCPLSQPTQKEIVDTRKVQADTDQIYVNLGAPPEDILKSRFGGDAYSFETKIDFDAMRKLAEQEADLAASQAELAAANAAAGVGAPPAPQADQPEDEEGEE